VVCVREEAASLYFSFFKRNKKRYSMPTQSNREATKLLQIIKEQSHAAPLLTTHSLFCHFPHPLFMKFLKKYIFSQLKPKLQRQNPKPKKKWNKNQTILKGN
jgi:hypothetical protein